jgi:1-acyl-sn-glycerol-3-phosphate acyltransferase
MVRASAATADCETRDSWFWQQDVNTVTSFAYVVVGAVVLGAVVRRRLPRAFAVLGVTAALAGFGSVWYHADSGDVGHAVHDVGLLAMLGFLAGWHVGRLLDATGAGAIVGAVLAAVAGGVAFPFSGASTNVLVGVAVAALVTSELAARVRGLPPVWTAPLVVLVAVAGGVWALGTPDSPICDDASLLQPHGVWHVLSAMTVLAWADRATAADDPLHPPRLWRHATDRAIGGLAWVLAHAFHRTVEVTGRARLPEGRPVLIVANHGNGFVDPIVVAAVLRRLPRFLAKAALWKVVPARPFLWLAGVLPVYRSSDGDRTAGNRSTFAACHHELGLGATVAIFPEGTTGDRAGLDRVRSGAARIALGALAEAPDVVVLPVGLAFESRIETRSRAVVMVGEPIAVAPYASVPARADADPARQDVERLTGAIRDALEAVSPEFESVEEREVLRAAARATLHESSRRRPPFAQVEVLARRMAAAPAAARARVADAYGRYALRLQLIGLDDRDVEVARTSRLRLAASIVALVLAGSLVVTATLIHLPAILLVVLATGSVRSTATKGTVRMLVGLVTLLATWAVAGAVLADGAGAFVAGVVVAVGGAAALAVWGPLTTEVAGMWARLRARDRAGLMPPVLEARADVVSAVRAAADA